MLYNMSNFKCFFYFDKDRRCCNNRLKDSSFCENHTETSHCVFIGKHNKGCMNEKYNQIFCKYHYEKIKYYKKRHLDYKEAAKKCKYSNYKIHKNVKDIIKELKLRIKYYQLIGKIPDLGHINRITILYHKLRGHYFENNIKINSS